MYNSKQLFYSLPPAVNSHDANIDYDTDPHLASSEEEMNITITRENGMFMFTLVLAFFNYHALYDSGMKKAINDDTTQQL